MIIRKVNVSEIRRSGKFLLNKNQKPKVINRNKISLPAGKELKTDFTKETKKANSFSMSKCSDYEPYDYCTPLFP